MSAGAHVSFRPREEPFEAQVDYVVVGSGAGGAAAAVTLARAGRSVAIVEAGAWRDPEHYPSTAYGGMRDLMDDWGAQVAMGRALWPVVQARTMGGTTVINSAICVRTPEDIFEQWAKEHGVTGLRDPVLAAQTRVEVDLHVEEVPLKARGRSNTLAKESGDKLGWTDSHWIHRYAKNCEGTGQCLQGCRTGAKQSTNLNYVPETRAKGGLILSCAPVERVLLQGTKATGVTGTFVHPATKQQGARFTVHATRGVVMAASVTWSPVLLMRSGVQSKVLGHFFRSHPGTGIFGCYPEPVDMNVGTTQGWASIAFRDQPGFKLETLAIPPELVASRFSGGGVELMKRLEEYRHVAMWCMGVRADTVGSIETSRFNHRPVVKYDFTPGDMKKLRDGLYLLARQHVAAGATAVIPGVSSLPFKLQANEIHRIDQASLDPRHYIAILSHLFGGCVMGKDPARSVTDEKGRVHGYQHLVVADASVIPTNLGVNPQHTIMGLAMTFAEAML
jgi:choline dehydrogenase-like flavoprotein